MAAMGLSGAVQAQLSLKRQKYDSIAAKYSNEHAVYTDDKHTLIIKEEDGQLTASTTTVAEKLFISEKSLNTFNGEGIPGGTFSYLIQADATAYIPEKNDYRVVKNLDKNGKVSLNYTGITRKTVTRTTSTTVHEELRMLSGFHFGNDVPTINSVYEVTVPKYVKMGFLVKGADTSRIQRSVTDNGGTITYRFSAANLPAEKEYDNVPSPLYYMTHVIPYVISFRFPGAKKDSLMTGSMDAHHKHKYSYVRGMNLKTDSFLNRKTAELTRHAYSDREKVARIYDWVQDNFHYEMLYLEDRDGFVPNPADTVCKRMYGDCKDMSSIIMAMCQKAGIPAYFAVIGTNDKPYTHDEIQTQNLYNHMICAVKIDGEWMFPDGTSHVQPLGTNRWDIQGKEAMIMLNDRDYKIVKIPEEPSSRSVTTMNTTMNLSYNDVNGSTSKQYTGYPAWEIGDALAYIRRKEEKDELVRSLAAIGNHKFLLKRYDINASGSGDKEVSLNADYTLGGYVQQVKKDYFVNMNVNRPFLDLRVTEEDRNVAAYHPHKEIIRETVTLNIPDGYRVTYLPKAAKGSVDGLWNYSFTYTSDPKSKTVTLKKVYELKTMKIDPAQFAANNKLVDGLKEQYKETVVLTAK
jgi:hypothetical protein